MPYVKKRTYKRKVVKPYKKRVFKRRSYVPRMPVRKPEMKTHDVTISSAISTTESVLGLSLIGQGDTRILRDGNMIQAKWLSLHLQLVMNASATASTTRIMILRDKQQVADIAPTGAQILTNVDIYGFLNKDSAGRFQILHDKCYAQDINGSDRSMFKKLNFSLNLPIRYNGTTGPDIQRNGLYLFAISTEATNTPTLSGYSRLGFYDY